MYTNLGYMSLQTNKNKHNIYVIYNCSYRMTIIGLLHDPVTWYGRNYAVTQVSKQRKVEQNWYEFL